MTSRSATPLVAALLAVALAGCGSPAARPDAAGPATRTPSAPSAPAASAPAGSGAPAPRGSSAPPARATTAVPARPGTTGGSSPAGEPNAEPRRVEPAKGVVDPKAEGTPEEIPIEAGVAPDCVRPGQPITLTARSKPNATMAFVAVYDGEKSGAAKPWGEGYGGNAEGEADGEGRWSSTWVVSLDAPAGDARVLLVVGSRGKQRAVNVPFSVGGREADGCGT